MDVTAAAIRLDDGIRTLTPRRRMVIRAAFQIDPSPAGFPAGSLLRSLLRIHPALRATGIEEGCAP